MEEKSEIILIQRINGVDIYAVKDETGKEFVPIKPVCQAIGVHPNPQAQKIKEHPIYSSVTTLRVATGTDGKVYDMLCIDAEFVYGWLLSINPDNVSEQARPKLIEYQLDCHHALHRYFHSRAQRQQEAIDIERSLVEQKDQLREKMADISKAMADMKAQIKDIDSKIAELQSERLNPQPSIFD